MLHRSTRFLLFILAFFIAVNCVQDRDAGSPDRISVAFMADVHFHDVFAEFGDGSFAGLPVTAGDDTLYAAIRTMEAQLTSTRLFNENYFAFKAALDDVVERGIRMVAFPGDFSDDGQPVHIRGFRNILDHYSAEYGLQFFIITGNHDPGRPFAMPAGKSNYLGEGGRRQPIFSKLHPVCRNPQSRRAAGSQMQSHEPVCTDEVLELGYEGLLAELGQYGMMPSEQYTYFETPFSSYTPASYDFETARKDAAYENRLYEICREGSGGVHREGHYTRCFEVMDASYLAEPVEGLWLLALDANVYVPMEDADIESPESPQNFMSPGNAGFNAFASHKKHLIAWIEGVAERAGQHGKTLIAFSHYPAADFYNGAGEEIRQLWGERRFQTARLPDREISQLLVSAGLKLHIGGHMHMNDTGLVFDEASGNTLFNVQSPSVAGYVPAYKIVHIDNSSGTVEIETPILKKVPGFDTLFPLYQTEWEYLSEIEYPDIWNRNVLEASDYYEFTDWHMEELSRLRFLPREWPGYIREKLTTMNGKEMLVASVEAGGAPEEKADSIAASHGFTLDDFESWDGIDLATDFYRIRNAGTLAFRDIPGQRHRQYAMLREVLKEFDEDDAFQAAFSVIFSVLEKFATGHPDDHFLIDLREGTIRDLTEKPNPF